MRRSPPWKRRPRPHHAQLHLPQLTAEESLLFVEIFERAIKAIWRAHGDSMADHLAMRGMETPPPFDAVILCDRDPNDPDNDDLPF